MPKAGGTFTGEVIFNDIARLNGPVFLGDTASDIITFNGTISNPLLNVARGRGLGTSDVEFATEKQVHD
jgi:hypothetical protein